jgi:hypothetical protein
MGFYVTQRQDSLATVTYGARYVFSELAEPLAPFDVLPDAVDRPRLGELRVAYVIC